VSEDVAAKAKKREYKIQIDRAKFEVETEIMTGAQLRTLPDPDIGPERDLFQIVPGEDDLKVEPEDKVKIKNGLRFFTAPAHINPGTEG
jgi:hypothetical protein